MAIERVEIKDFLVFKGDFTADFCPGVNVFIGGNGCGKTTILKVMYAAYTDHFDGRGIEDEFEDYFGAKIDYSNTSFTIYTDENARIKNTEFNKHSYIPEKDILEHAKGLLTFIEQKETGFNRIYKNVLIAAMDIPTREQTETQKSVGQKISNITNGNVLWEQSEGTFYSIKTDGTKIPFANEASGYKKLGYLGLLVASGQLNHGSVLFWDEPENSLNPELMPKLVEILLELSRSGVQIFLATHSEFLANEFFVSSNDDDSLKYFSLYKDESGSIKADTDRRFDLLNPNRLTETSVDQYKRELDKGLDDED
jgi:predicted ATP-dependent endonuclease of OLD family